MADSIGNIKISTGIESINQVIDRLRIGDNVVWQVDDIRDYQYFVKAYVKEALTNNKRVVYIRFAKHKPLIEPEDGVVCYKLDSDSGFEAFSTQIHSILTKEGEEVYYVFDCLSHLLDSWATDMMIVHFFFITCPYLYELKTIAYFSILRGSHSYSAIASIRRITQLLINVYSIDKKLYIHPLKVQGRYSQTMFLPHLQQGNELLPITDSFQSSRLLSLVDNNQPKSAKRKLDYWDRLFWQAESLSNNGNNLEKKAKMVIQLCSVMMTKNEKMLKLLTKYLSLDDLVKIKDRLIGTGYLGGKTVGMLLARAILAQDRGYCWDKSIEEHDSFYVGSDVFYSYLVENGWWKLRMEQKTVKGYYQVATELRKKILTGKFSTEIVEQFQQVLDYFGQSPIIIRSSSLLEDGFGNAFAGKYESIFCTNQGTPEERYQTFEQAVRKVYASMFNEDALVYRLQRGLAFEDEQMALLLQRVSGSYNGDYYFPYVAGVGISYNTFVWNSILDSEAGMLRLVLGLGTRAVNRVDKDYPRLVALDAPLIRPIGGLEDKKRFSQHYVDLLNIVDRKFETISIGKLMNAKPSIDLELIGVQDFQATNRLKELNLPEQEVWFLTFDKLLSETNFTQKMQRMLKLLEKAYDYPVDIEFTVNITKDNNFKINLLQCRPLKTKSHKQFKNMPSNIPMRQLLFKANASFMGGSIIQSIKRVIYVDPDKYSNLSESGKYEVARLIGKINRHYGEKKYSNVSTMLIGPGRWGTATPSLGVPVSFAEISNISVLVEIAHKRGGFTPELSYGTHFFQDLVEADIFYVALFPKQQGVVCNFEKILEAPNQLEHLNLGHSPAHQAIKVWELSEQLIIAADIVSQKALCYFEA